jgi:hypothetical protein
MVADTARFLCTVRSPSNPIPASRVPGDKPRGLSSIQILCLKRSHTAGMTTAWQQLDNSDGEHSAVYKNPQHRGADTSRLS